MNSRGNAKGEISRKLQLLALEAWSHGNQSNLEFEPDFSNGHTDGQLQEVIEQHGTNEHKAELTALLEGRDIHAEAASSILKGSTKRSDSPIPLAISEYVDQGEILWETKYREQPQNQEILKASLILAITKVIEGPAGSTGHTDIDLASLSYETLIRIYKAREFPSEHILPCTIEWILRHPDPHQPAAASSSSSSSSSKVVPKAADPKVGNSNPNLGIPKSGKVSTKVVNPNSGKPRPIVDGKAEDTDDDDNEDDNEEDDDDEDEYEDERDDYIPNEGDAADSESDDDTVTLRRKRKSRGVAAAAASGQQKKGSLKGAKPKSSSASKGQTSEDSLTIRVRYMSEQICAQHVLDKATYMYNHEVRGSCVTCGKSKLTTFCLKCSKIEHPPKLKHYCYKCFSEHLGEEFVQGYKAIINMKKN